MRSNIGRSGKEEYLAVPAKIGKRLESEEGNPRDARLVLVKKCFLRLEYQVRVVGGGSHHIHIKTNQEQICQDGGSHEDFTGLRSGHSNTGGRNPANQFNLIGNVFLLV